jgi:predicted ester cyclase
MLDAEGIVHGLADDTTSVLRGPENFKPFHAKFREAFPGMAITVDDTVAEGDKVAARCSVRGKHEGHSLGVAPTQVPVEFTGMTIVRISDGKIVEAWNNFDFMTMLQQVGVIPRS